MTGSPKSALAFSPTSRNSLQGFLGQSDLSGSVTQGAAGVCAGVPGLCLNSLHGAGLCEPSAAFPVSCDCFTGSFAEVLLPLKDPERKQQHGGLKKVTVGLNPSQEWSFNK